jgi:hypothetical protein
VDAKRAAAIRKVRSLAEMTVENGCTQPEQDSATEAARRIIAKHGLSYAEVVGGTSEVRPNRAPPESEQPTYGGYTRAGGPFQPHFGSANPVFTYSNTSGPVIVDTPFGRIIING